jgi:ATP-dependent 26S proteasome regulatory subunit
VSSFIKARGHIKSLGLSAKKGLLFYGPPGTGKTHTIHYLASQLPGHTTLLITAEQVGLLDEYFRLARFLQPSMVIVEDVDLIARAREQMSSVCEEVLLNKLLNEMDGLREDADVIFILTTNRPDQLEPALASRPGRIDQAIEFPLPDEQGRSKLVKLYSRGLELPEELLELIVRRTKGTSPAFIKELMRRAAQFQFEMKADGKLEQAALDGAIEEMVFSGGTLNLKLLGGSSAEFGSGSEPSLRPLRTQ